VVKIIQTRNCRRFKLSLLDAPTTASYRSADPGFFNTRAGVYFLILSLDFRRVGLWTGQPFNYAIATNPISAKETVMSAESLLVILLIGAIAGWLAGQIVQGTGFGLVGDIVIGIVGALIASLLFPKLGLRLGSGIAAEIIAATIGAVLLLVVVRLVRRGGRW